MDHPAGIDLQYCGQISVILLQNRPLYIDRFFWLVTESGLKKINPNQTLGVFFMTDITGLVMVPPSFFKILKPVEPD